MTTNIQDFSRVLKLKNGMPTEVWEQRDFYTYSLYSASIAPSATETLSVNIQADADFVVTQMCFVASIANASLTESTKVVPLARILLNDTGSGRNLSDVAVDIPSIAGDGSLPFILPIARRFMAKSTIQANVTNYSAATTYTNLRVYLIGYKAWEWGNV